MMGALVSHKCGPGSNPGVDAICGLGLLLVPSLVPRGFSPCSPVFLSPRKPTLPNSNSIWNAQTRLNEFLLSVSWVNKFQTTIYNLHGVRPADLFFSIDTPTKLVKDDVVEIRVSFKLP